MPPAGPVKDVIPRPFSKGAQVTYQEERTRPAGQRGEDRTPTPRRRRGAKVESGMPIADEELVTAQAGHPAETRDRIGGQDVFPEGRRR